MWGRNVLQAWLAIDQQLGHCQVCLSLHLSLQIQRQSSCLMWRVPGAPTNSNALLAGRVRGLNQFICLPRHPSSSLNPHFWEWQPLWGRGILMLAQPVWAPLQREAEGCEGLYLFSLKDPAIKITCLETSSLKGRKKLLYPRKWL